MSETSPSTPPPAPTSSVVIETNAVVPQRRGGLIAAAVVAVVALAGFVVWAFTAGGDDDYTPGPVAKAFQDQLDEQGIERDLTSSELRCIDDKGKDIDPEMLDDGTFDPLGDEMPSGEMATFTGGVLDDCLMAGTRVALMVDGMTDDGSMDEEQATCLATALDTSIVDGGGYTALMEDPESMAGMMFSLFGAMEECGLDLGDMMTIDG